MIEGFGEVGLQADGRVVVFACTRNIALLVADNAAIVEGGGGAPRSRLYTSSITGHGTELAASWLLSLAVSGVLLALSCHERFLQFPFNLLTRRGRFGLSLRPNLRLPDCGEV